MKYKNILITGGLGFIGSHFLTMLIKNKIKANIVCLDLETYAANLKFKNLYQDKITFIKGDICDKKLVLNLFEKFDFDLIVNFAAQSHVDNSILEDQEFLNTNILGVQNLLNNIKNNKNCFFIQISTDEVYGELNFDSKPSLETDILKPSSVYSASKSCAEQLIFAANKTHNVNYLITRCSNNFGINQHIEKFIPTIITSLKNKTKIPVYGDGLNIRDWICVEDHVDAIWYLINADIKNEIINIGSNNPMSNLDLIKLICTELNLNYQEHIKFVPNRLGHDLRYNLDCLKLNNLGFKANKILKNEIKEVINFYLGEK